MNQDITRKMPACKLHHTAIQTASFDKAFQFYSVLLGLPVVKEPFDFRGTRTLAWLDAGGILIELYSVKHGLEPDPYCNRRIGADHIAFVFDDLDEAVNGLTANGVKVLKHPFLPPTGEANQPRVAFIEGPDGEEIELRETERGG